MGVMIEQPDYDDGGGIKIVYQPWIMWNLEILSYISAPIEISKYRGYKCLVKVLGGGDFNITFDANEFHHSFKKVHETIVKKTHGVLILQKPIDNSLWTEFVPKLLLEAAPRIFYQRPAGLTQL